MLCLFSHMGTMVTKERILGTQVNVKEEIIWLCFEEVIRDLLKRVPFFLKCDHTRVRTYITCASEH